jgi:clan AA aspartic protease
MGVFYVNGELAHPGDPKRRRQLRFLVETGAFYTVVPRDVLAALKGSPIREERVQFADGRKARWKVGEARLEIDGRSVTTLVLFGKKGTQPLLGAYSLEGLALSVDSRRRRLVPRPLVIVARSETTKVVWRWFVVTNRPCADAHHEE